MIEFKIHPKARWEATTPWGGGHTVTTDPTRKGWRFRVLENGSAVFGRPGVAGAFHARFVEGAVDVIVYDALTPQEVDAALRRGEHLPYAAALRIPAIPGWALKVLDVL